MALGALNDMIAFLLIEGLLFGVREHSFSVGLKLALREEVLIQGSGAIMDGSGSVSG